MNPDFPVVGYIQLDNSLLEISEIVNGLEVPWDIETAEDGKLWFTQINGTLHLLDLKTGRQKMIYQVPGLIAKKSYGLLGMAVHPEKKWVFLHYTFAKEQGGLDEEIFSRLERYTFNGQTLGQAKIILDSLPGATYHNGSRIAISEDGKLYFSLGDVGKVDLVLDDAFAGGKIHRLNLDGSIPEDNPIPGSSVWAKGLRNSQGLAFGKNGKLYGSDHGAITDDEINLLTKGGNYGWPEVHGYIDQEKEKLYASNYSTKEPLIAWTPTIAAAGLAFYHTAQIPEWENSLLLATMKGMSIRILHLDETGNQILSEDIFLQKSLGRIRDIAVASDGSIYFSTSNRDWHPRFQPWMYDGLPEGPDRILRIRKMGNNEKPIHGLPVFKKESEAIALMDENWNYGINQELESGAKLYNTHCLVCHGPEGKGSEDLIPPISETDWVVGDKGRLIRLMLAGLSGKIEVNGKQYNQEMPAFDHLTDRELADILTFLRNHFGNKASAVIPGEVYEERKGLRK
ncbi:PQQ-dependent sugar dehydrogenase [Cecembia calidifontis]|uniref:Glucose/arabinose dehydrogenase n=1 Tax=Cecembia calidifontis TaxID=1187080 RepID=A0A4Q7PAH3_9BACT|nr:PQQ-dependent sugar dehydrogenase [Cecembia calidifontis]RZS97276.1 glucose/arabinose dehydrogenase [Cecembia calidifontis]